MELTSEFNNVTQGDGASTSGSGSEAEPQGTSLDPASQVSASSEMTRTNPSHQSLDDQTEHYEAAPVAYSIEEAQAELELLETGRAEPTPKHELKPPRAIAKFGLILNEGKREARILALQAYIHSHREDRSFNSEQDLNEGPTLTL